MQAILTRSDGDTATLQVREVPDPVPGPHDVVIDVAAAGVNRADVLQRRGLYPSPPGWPQWPGLECSGVVSAVGAAVTTVAIGDRVCALLGGGGYAQKVAAPASLVLPVPDGLSLAHAGAVMEAACTVWSNLDAVSAHAGQTLLVHGGSGGVGTTAIQIATALGLTVAVTAGGPERSQRCRDLGADLAIDYHADDFVEALTSIGGADIILDSVGKAYAPRNLAALRPGGSLVVIGLQSGSTATIDLATVLTKNVTIVGTTLRSRALEDKARIVAGVRGDVWPLIPDQFTPVMHAAMPLADAAAAHAMLEAGEVFGKVVLEP